MFNIITLQRDYVIKIMEVRYVYIIKTFYNFLAPALHQALKLKVLETSRSMPDIINDAVKEALAEKETAAKI